MELLSYDTHVVKGLLQTEEFMRAVLSMRRPLLDHETIEQCVAARLTRQEVFDRWPVPLPLVLGPHNVPVITDPAEAARDIPLATLSAVTHAKEPGAAAILKTLASAMKTLDETTATLFSDFTELGLGDTPAAHTWRKLMAIDLSLLHGPTSQRLRAEGRAEGTAQSILRLLDQRGIDVSDDIRERITGCHDLDTLDVWLSRTLTVTSAQELFVQD